MTTIVMVIVFWMVIILLAYIAVIIIEHDRKIKHIEKQKSSSHKFR